MAESQSTATHRSRLLLFLLAPSFYCVEWLLVAASASLFAWLKFRGLPATGIWLLFWAANLAVSTVFLACNDRVQVDFTLMQALRRGTELATGRCRWCGLVLEVALCLRLLLWEGPCQLLIYLRPRLPSPAWQVPLLVAASGVQMLIWTRVYILGYAGIGELLQLWKGGPP